MRFRMTRSSRGVTPRQTPELPWLCRGDCTRRDTRAAKRQPGRIWPLASRHCDHRAQPRRPTKCMKTRAGGRARSDDRLPTYGHTVWSPAHGPMCAKVGAVLSPALKTSAWNCGRRAARQVSPYGSGCTWRADWLTGSGLPASGAWKSSVFTTHEVASGVAA